MTASALSQSDLAAYLARTGYAGAQEASPAVLQALMHAHLAAIPFENLDPLLHRPVDIALPAVTAKLVHSRRGGYCFEQNHLFFEALAHFGFDVVPLAARVIWQAPPDAPVSPLTHRFTKVRMPDGDWLADVGFGGQSPTSPLLLARDREQQTEHGCYRFVEWNGGLELQLQRADGWAGMYRFTQEPKVFMDFEMGNWFTSTFPRSHFRSTLVMGKVTETGRINIRNRVLLREQPGAATKAEPITGPEELQRIFEEIYGVTPPAPAASFWDRIPEA